MATAVAAGNVADVAVAAELLEEPRCMEEPPWQEVATPAEVAATEGPVSVHADAASGTRNFLFQRYLS